MAGTAPLTDGLSDPATYHDTAPRASTTTEEIGPLTDAGCDTTNELAGIAVLPRARRQGGGS